MNTTTLWSKDAVTAYEGSCFLCSTTQAVEQYLYPSRSKGTHVAVFWHILYVCVYVVACIRKTTSTDYMVEVIAFHG
jgi:hypothetical protein